MNVSNSFMQIILNLVISQDIIRLFIRINIHNSLFLDFAKKKSYKIYFIDQEITHHNIINCGKLMIHYLSF